MKFRFDEVAIEGKFRDRLDEYMLGALTVRPKPVDSELGTRIIVLDKLAKQNNPDVIAMIVRQLTEALSLKIVELQATTSRVLLVYPLQFNYIRGRFNDNGEKLLEGGFHFYTNGTEILVTAKIREVE
ncbi:hypothetical protein LCGC14_2618300 [marine sediment metagenome]|uniref:Uncharacterized protein n=1 Tax=marine sediment metagenome TaxID=412755 RepID=A0A0F9ARI3_9ZZZZ